jgi:hypothetical protein
MTNRRERKYSGAERRRWARLNPSDLPFLKSVAFNQGSEVQVVDISQGGMLLETEMRLQPKMKVILRLESNTDEHKIEGYVLRSSIASLQGAPRYRSAIIFRHPIDKLLDQVKDQQKKHKPEALPGPVKTSIPPKHVDIEPPQISAAAEPKVKPATLTLIAKDTAGHSLSQTFTLNDW